MLKAASETRQRCAEHPHRRATRQCLRCKTPFCDECARTQQDARGFCLKCQEEVDALEAIEHPPLEERVRRFRLSLRNALIGLAVLAVLAIPITFFAKDLMSQPITPEELARFKYAAAGTFELQEGTDVLSTVLGAEVLSATSQQPGYEAKHLIDEYYGDGYPGWRSTDNSFPQEVVFAADGQTQVEKLFIVQHPLEPPETDARDIEVFVSTTSPDGPWQSIGTFTLTQSHDPQRFTFPGVDAHWIKLVVKSNYGGPYTSLTEFEAFLLPRGQFGQITPEATP